MTAEQHTLAKYLLELTMVDYEMAHFAPSMVASAALALTLKMLAAGEWVSVMDRTSLPCILHVLTINELIWSEMSPQDVTLQHYMDYTAESLIPVMAHIAKNVVKVNDGLTKHLVSSSTLCLTIVC